MKTIEFKSNFGRFAYEASCEIGDEVNEATTNLALRGMADTCFRGVSSEVEKALVAAKLMTEEQKRSEVLYSQEAATLIGVKGTEKLKAICEKQKLPAISFKVVGEHVFGEASDKPTKAATEMWTSIQSLVGDKFEKALVYLGLDEDYDDESGILACKAKITAAKAEAEAKQKADLEAAIG